MEILMLTMVSLSICVFVSFVYLFIYFCFVLFFVGFDTVYVIC